LPELPTPEPKGMQDTHEVPAALGTKPTLHMSHVERPGDAAKRPAGQDSQVTIPASGATEPIGHNLHCADPGTDAAEPGAHTEHDVAPASPLVLEPAAHSVHTELPGDEAKVPGAQRRQAVPVTSGKEPAGHSAQPPVALSTLPAEHCEGKPHGCRKPLNVDAQGNAETTEEEKLLSANDTTHLPETASAASPDTCVPAGAATSVSRTAVSRLTEKTLPAASDATRRRAAGSEASATMGVLPMLSPKKTLTASVPLSGTDNTVPPVAKPTRTISLTGSAAIAIGFGPKLAVPTPEVATTLSTGAAVAFSKRRRTRDPITRLSSR
jgi:hypothetical protein